MLYKPEAFERLTEAPWDEGVVRDRIRAIVADADEAWRGPKLMWRAQEWDRWGSTSPQKNLYVGAAGVLWALDQLRRRGYADSTLDLGDLAVRNLELFRAKPDYMKVPAFKPPEPRDSALLLGEAGILLVTWRLSPSDELANDLHARVRANVENEAVEIMWGAPGTLLVARGMLEWTGDDRWRDAWHETAEALLARREDDGLWTSRLYGQEFKSLTPPHGLVGNVRALLGLLGDERAAALKRDALAILRETVVRDDGLANWPTRPGQALAHPQDGEIRVQWCAGSPGMIIAAADYLDEDLLLAGAELPWHTGPNSLDKGPGICHGTAGNGYAFLKAFARTGDERWLERARRFAMHALEQRERLPSRHSLFTGGIGAALYAADCIEGRTHYPILDYV